jgi:hypothetical protein
MNCPYRIISNGLEESRLVKRDGRSKGKRQTISPREFSSWKNPVNVRAPIGRGKVPTIQPHVGRSCLALRASSSSLIQAPM